MKPISSFFALFVLLGIVFILGIALLWEMSVYNRLDALNRKVDQQWAQTEKAYKLQLDLTSNLLKITSKLNFFQKPELNEIIDAQAWVEHASINVKKCPKDAGKLAEFEKAQESLSWNLERFFIIAKHNPGFKSDKDLKDLFDQFEKAGDKISSECDHFNNAVQVYNSAFRLIPGSSILKILGQHKKPSFTLTENRRAFSEYDFENVSSSIFSD